MVKIENPLIPGFSPDPSCIYVDGTYYLVCSSFLFWPGVPVYASKDLEGWKHIGTVINRPEQLDYSECRMRPGTTNCGGIWAPTIRYHDGVFYVVTTNVFPHKEYGDYSRWQNVIFSTTDPLSNNWSDPVYFEFPGYDTSLFWDDDGKAYVQGSFYWRIRYEISQYEIDLKTGKSLSGEPRALWPGTGGIAPEAPHMYKRNGHYYLMIAEGATEFGHCVTIARSSSVWGPFEPNPSNPIASAASPQSLFQTVGHADLFSDDKDNWYAVMLASRVIDGHYPMGRESVLTPVDWSGDWPVFDLSAIDVPASFPDPDASANKPWKDVLAMPEHAFLHLRVPRPGTHKTVSQGDGLSPKRILQAEDVPLTATLGSPAFIGFRQRHLVFETEVELVIPHSAPPGFKAGYATYLDHERHFAATVVNDRVELISVQPEKDAETVGDSFRLPPNARSVRIRIHGTPTTFTFSAAVGGGDGNDIWTKLGECDTRILSAGFTGNILSVFAVSPAASIMPEVEIIVWRYRGADQ